MPRAKIDISKEWCMNMARLEGDSEIGAGLMARDPVVADSRPRNRYTPANCPHCEYDRRFPPLEGGGWLQQDNNGPIVPCPVCNDDGKHPRG